MKTKRVEQSGNDHNRDAVIESVFKKHYRPGATDVPFTMKDILDAIAEVSKSNPSYKKAMLLMCATNMRQGDALCRQWLMNSVRG